MSHWSVNHWSGNLVNHWSGHFVNLISWDVDLIFWALLIKVLDVVTKWFDLTVHCFKGLEHSEEVSSAYVISEMVSDVPTFIESVTSTAWEVSKGLLMLFAVIHKTIIDYHWMHHAIFREGVSFNLSFQGFVVDAV